MEIMIKREFYNGLFDCLEIYHDTNKILEISKNIYWEATSAKPIVIAKSKIKDFMVSDKIIASKNYEGLKEVL